MHPDFWHERWAAKQIGFHEALANPRLVKHFSSLNLPTHSRIFVPLCGKTLDIHWLLQRKHRVVGVELSRLAIDQLFDELKIKPSIVEENQLLHYHADGIDIFVGDVFDLTASMLGAVDAIYDRAALVALPIEMRQRYSSHVMTVTRSAPQLLVCFEYDQKTMQGPPFAIDSSEVKQHYANAYNITLLERDEVPGKLKGQVAMESVWLLRKKSD